MRILLHRDFFDYAAIEPELQGFDACFFCLGVSAAMEAWRNRARAGRREPC